MGFPKWARARNISVLLLIFSNAYAYILYWNVSYNAKMKLHFKQNLSFAHERDSNANPQSRVSPSLPMSTKTLAPNFSSTNYSNIMNNDNSSNRRPSVRNESETGARPKWTIRENELKDPGTKRDSNATSRMPARLEAVPSQRFRQPRSWRNSSGTAVARRPPIIPDESISMRAHRAPPRTKQEPPLPDPAVLPAALASRSAQYIIFIRLQKVGSSTLRNVLFRYAREHGLPTGSDAVAAGLGIFAEHSTLPAHLAAARAAAAAAGRRATTAAPPLFLALLRAPLAHAASFFYWNWHDRDFRREAPGNFSARHLEYLWIYARQAREGGREGGRERERVEKEESHARVREEGGWGGTERERE